MIRRPLSSVMVLFHILPCKVKGGQVEGGQHVVVRGMCAVRGDSEEEEIFGRIRARDVKFRINIPEGWYPVHWLSGY